MRVIAGKAKRIKLNAPAGIEVRPTTDRIKETLFNMIQDELYDINFLDLFSGSGGIGIEAVSRGASKAWFVENNKKTCEIIKDNLLRTHLDDQSVILNMNALSAVKSLAGKTRFQIVFMDPPYGRGYEKQIMSEPSFNDILDDNALVIVEADLDTTFCQSDHIGLRFIKEKIYKTNKHVFFEKIGG